MFVIVIVTNLLWLKLIICGLQFFCSCLLYNALRHRVCRFHTFQICIEISWKIAIIFIIIGHTVLIWLLHIIAFKGCVKMLVASGQSTFQEICNAENCVPVVQGGGEGCWRNTVQWRPLVVCQCKIVICLMKSFNLL